MTFRGRRKLFPVKEMFLSQSPENSSGFQFQCILPYLLPDLPEGKSFLPSNLSQLRQQVTAQTVNAGADREILKYQSNKILFQ